MQGRLVCQCAIKYLMACGLKLFQSLSHNTCSTTSHGSTKPQHNSHTKKRQFTGVLITHTWASLHMHTNRGLWSTLTHNSQQSVIVPIFLAFIYTLSHCILYLVYLLACWPRLLSVNSVKLKVIFTQCLSPFSTSVLTLFEADQTLQYLLPEESM